MKRITVAGGLLCVVFLSLYLVGCQTPGKVEAVENSPVCPNCKTETRSHLIDGLSYTKHICKSCRTEITADPHGATTYGQDGQGLEQHGVQTVHVCDKCKAIIGECPQCKKQ